MKLSLIAALALFASFSVAAMEVHTSKLHLVFSDQGDLLSARSCLPDCHNGLHQAVFGDRLVVFNGDDGAPILVRRQDNDGQVLLDFESADASVTRHWLIPTSGWQIELKVSGSSSLTITPGDGLKAPPADGFGVWLEAPRYVITTKDGTENLALDEIHEPRQSQGWAGLRNRFWTVMAYSGPLTTSSFRDSTDGAPPGLVLEHNNSLAEISFYLGPVEPGALRSADPQLHQMLYSNLWFWLRWICMGLYWLMALIHTLIPNWGLTIMVLSLSVNILMRPLSRIADRLQDSVHKTQAQVGPELKAIQSSSKGEEQSKRILALYKAHGVHPLYSLKSLAGVAVVIPVFIGAFDMLAENIWLSQESMLWIRDLARPDAFTSLPFSLPFFGGQLNLLPFVMTILSVVASVLHRHEAMDTAQFGRHKRNLILMALAFLALFYTFPAGMVLYWTTNNLISVIKYGWQKMYRGPSSEAG